MRYDTADKTPQHPDGKPYEPTWPQADFIIGNPPFFGGKLLRRELGNEYIDYLFDLYKGRVKAESDLVVYWFEKARAQLELNAVKRVGLLATQGIRGGANRIVLERIQQIATIFWAWSDRHWLLKGATVHVSMIAFERGNTISAEPVGQAPTARHIPAWAEGPGMTPPEDKGLKARHINPSGNNPFPYLLDGVPVPYINPDLTTGSNTASAQRLKENQGLCFMGTTKVGPFDIDAKTVRKMLLAPLNPNGRPNSDVDRPWVNALDITRRPRNMFVIDFGTDMTEAAAALYELPFEYVRHHVKPVRLENNRATYATNWWIHGEARGDLRQALKPLSRYILTSRVSKHRLFIWLTVATIPDSATFAIARQDDYFFGVLHSSIHEIWARAQGTQLREVESGFRYTPNSTFAPFPSHGRPPPNPPKSTLPWSKPSPTPPGNSSASATTGSTHNPHPANRSSPKPTSKTAPSPSSTTYAPPANAPGWKTPIAPWIRPSSPPTAGLRTSPRSKSLPTSSPSITSAPPLRLYKNLSSPRIP